MNTIRAFIFNRRLAILSGGSALAIAAGLLFWRLGTLVPGYSEGEVAAHNQALDLQGMLNNPINLPYTALSRLFLEINTHSLFLGRVAALALGLVVVFLFYWLVQHWHDHRTAFFATILFACSTRFLLTARQGSAEVLLFGLFALIVYGVWLKDHLHIKWSLPLGLLAVCVLLYVPGMIWFVVAGIIWQWQTIAHKLWRTPLWLTIATVLPALALLFPLGWGMVKHPHLIETVIGLPHPFPTPSDILHNLLSIPRDLFYVHAIALSDVGTVGLLTLDALSIVLFIFGCYLYLRHFGLSRTLFLIGIGIIACFLIGLGSMSVSVLLPFVYLLIAAGIAYFLGEWLAVFPRNIFARTLGIALLSILIALSCAYNLRRYFVAWPLSTETRTEFTQKLPPAPN